MALSMVAFFETQNPNSPERIIYTSFYLGFEKYVVHHESSSIITNKFQTSEKHADLMAIALDWAIQVLVLAYAKVFYSWGDNLL